jgi:hypothetical protein
MLFSSFLLIFISYFFISCGTYQDTRVDLTPEQIEAIESKLAEDCLTEKAKIFSDLKTATNNAFKDGLAITKGDRFKITQTNSSEQTLVVLKIDATNLYVYISGSLPARVYNYTKVNNQAHLDFIKVKACAGGNTFTEDLNNFSYQVNKFEPDKENKDRVEQKSSFTIKNNLPAFFSLFNRTYSKLVYDDGLVVDDEKQDIKVTYEKLEDVDIDDFETRFNLASHCTFSSVSWLDLTANNYLAEGSPNLVCNQNTFNWNNDIKI